MQLQFSLKPTVTHIAIVDRLKKKKQKTIELGTKLLELWNNNRRLTCFKLRIVTIFKQIVGTDITEEGVTSSTGKVNLLKSTEYFCFRRP